MLVSKHDSFNGGHNSPIYCCLANVQISFSNFHLVVFSVIIRKDNKIINRTSECNTKCYNIEQIFIACEKVYHYITIKRDFS